MEVNLRSDQHNNIFLLVRLRRSTSVLWANCAHSYSPNPLANAYRFTGRQQNKRLSRMSLLYSSIPRTMSAVLSHLV